MPMDIKVVRRGVALIVLVLWLICLFLPAVSFAKAIYSYLSGAFVAVIGLAFGWLELQFGAFANPILLGLCLVLLLGRRPWVALAWITEVLALSSFTITNIPDHDGPNPISHFSSGFYVWQAAILLLLLYLIFEKTLVKAGYISAPTSITLQS